MSDDTAKREEFSTGSVRDSRVGKGRFDLLPMLAIWMLAKHFEKGAAHYGDHNWRKGQPISRYFDSMSRHLTEFALGITDKDHSSPWGHLVAACWNGLCAIETMYMVRAGELPYDLLDMRWMHGGTGPLAFDQFPVTHASIPNNANKSSDAPGV